jgi:hypothetical protein
LALAGAVLLWGARRIRRAEYATSRRNAYRVTVASEVWADDISGELLDISVGGAAVRFRHGYLPGIGLINFELPGAPGVKAEVVRMIHQDEQFDIASIRVLPGDWAAYQAISLWMFHTPAGAIEGLPSGVPVIACARPA